MELYALTEEQKAFIDIVISLAEEQAIPPSIVEKCFFYARNRRNIAATTISRKPLNLLSMRRDTI